jgi:signal transduction histidine kinase
MQFSASIQPAALPEHLSLVHPSEITEPRRLPRFATLWGLLFVAYMYRTLRNGLVWQGESRNRKKDGSCYWVDNRVVPTLDRRGRIARYTAICIDITSRKHAEEQLLHAKDAAEAASRAKTDFLAAMSHEIRTPMNGIIGCTDLLLETQLDFEQRDLAGTIRDSSHALLSVIDDVLDLARIEAGRVQVKSEPFAAKHVVSEVMNLLKPRALQKSLALRVEWDATAPITALGDAGRFRQVLLNLGSNALKFTAAGHVTLRVSVANEMLRFAIQDSGIGIAESLQPQLFAKFVQADSSATRKHGGTGLGLVISKQLVELMGGMIGVESRLGHGSTFWFTLPLAAGTVPDPARAALALRAVTEPRTQRLRAQALHARGSGKVTRPVVCCSCWHSAHLDENDHSAAFGQSADELPPDLEIRGAGHLRCSIRDCEH